MSLFEHRYYRLNKTLMMFGGYWPYQSSLARYTRYIISNIFLVCQVVPQTLALIKYLDDPKILFECFITFVFEAICVIKGLGLLCNVQMILKLLDGIRKDWQVWARDRDVNILHDYAEQGRKMSIMYTAAIYIAIIVYTTQPIIPTIIDVLLENGTAPRKFPYPVDYYHLNVHKYYWYIIMYTYVFICIGLIVVVATEVMLIMYVQHVCGIFAALGRKFQRIGNNKISVKSGGTPYPLDIVDLPLCVDRHNAAINYARLIDASYTWSIFFVAGFGIILLNVVGLQILMTKSEPEATLRSIGILLAIVLHLYVVCIVSEILMDHSISIHLYIQKSQWYNLASEAQTSLPLMMMLSGIPCQLTAGNYVTLSMRTVAQTLRAAMSYFTVVRSMQL